MRLFTYLILFFCTTIPVSAALLVTTPSQACALLSDVGLVAGDWKNEYDQEYGCSSNYKQLGTGSPLANNLAFYVEGSSSSVIQVYLMLNVNNKASASSAHQELLKVTEALSKKETGKQLPRKLIDAIKNGSNTSQNVGAAIVDVIRNDWPTGRGYEIKVTIK